MLSHVSLTWCSPLFSSFRYRFPLSKWCIQVFGSGVTVQFMIVSNSLFLLAINHSCMPLKEKFRLPLPCLDFCPLSGLVVPLEEYLSESAFWQMSLLIYHRLYEDLTMINKVKHSCRTVLWCFVLCTVEPLLLIWSPTREICPLCICSHFLSLVIYLYLTRDSRDLGPPTMAVRNQSAQI